MFSNNHQSSYQAKSYDLSRLNGISDETLEIHFKLYEGYVKATNELSAKISELLSQNKIDHETMPEYSELKRRFGFEYNGMVLHEYYFENLRRNSENPKVNSNFYKKTEMNFGSYDVWKADFINTGKMRGIGWVVCYEDPSNVRLSNHWITLHDGGNIAGFKPILVMDMWEHAYLLDFKPSQKELYLEAFFSNIDWQSVEIRLS